MIQELPTLSAPCGCLTMMGVRNCQRAQCFVAFINQKMRAHYKTEKHKQPMEAECRFCNKRKKLRTLQNQRAARDELQMNSRYTLFCECLVMVGIRHCQRARCFVPFINQKMKAHYKSEKHEQPMETEPRTCNKRKTCAHCRIRERRGTNYK